MGKKPLVSQATIDEVGALAEYDTRCMRVSQAKQGDFFTCDGKVGTLILLSDHETEMAMSDVQFRGRYAPCWNIQNRAHDMLPWNEEIVLTDDIPF